MAMRVALISDIHAAAGPYRLALDSARREGFDRLVIMGDLLTYGAAPVETVALTREAIERDGAVLLRGNHDQIYFDLDSGGSAYVDALPGWIRESADWTLDQIGGADVLRRFVWEEEWEAGPLLAAHANPFGAGDWTYLNGPEPMERACQVLAERGLSFGVFGHVHRFRRHAAAGVEVTTIGSIGQPRDRDDKAPQWAMAELADGRVSVERRLVEHDWSDDIAMIDATTLSQATKERLVSFLA
jgi:predicted phosphodiesterase